jgi:hypothetical protein
MTVLTVAAEKFSPECVAMSVDFQRVSPSATPRGWRRADYATERAREVLLIAHTALQRNPAKGVGRRQHQSLGHLDAPAQYILAWCRTIRAFERAAEVAGAETQESRDFFNADPSR